MAWAAVIGAGASLAGGYLASKGGSKQSGEQTVTNKQELDPRAALMLYGDDKEAGLLSRYRAMLDTPQNSSLRDFSQRSLDYLDGATPDSISQIRNAGASLLNGSSARASLPAYAVGNMVQAPSQNKLDLSGSYRDLIYGAPGANPYLMGGIQRGINQSANAFQDLQSSATKNLLQDVLPSIRSNSVLYGQYGGSRQGIAEGRALGDFATAQQQAVGRFGQNNTDAAVAAQAGAYDADRNRQLAATQGLGAQQYGVAQQNAATRNAAEFMNVGNAFDASKFNAGMDLAGKQAGANLLNGLNSNAYQVAQNQDNYTLNRTGQVNSLLQPYLSLGGSSTSTQPLYENRTANALGGASAGLGLFNQFSGGGSGSKGTMSSLFGWDGSGGLFGKNSYY